MIVNFVQKLKEKLWAQLFIIYTRYLIGGAFVLASIVKLEGKRFTKESGLEEPINSAWHFFETMYESGLYWRFLGLGQLVAGLLLMTQRYSKLGALLFLPIISNVFVITISYYFAGTPIITGLMLLATLALIIWDWNENRILFNLPVIAEKQKRLEKDSIWSIGGVSLFLFTFGYRFWVKAYDLLTWVGISVLIGIISLILGVRKRKQYPKPIL